MTDINTKNNNNDNDNANNNNLKKGPIKAHLEKCVGSFTLEIVDILGSTSTMEMHLLTLEAL